MISDSAPPLPAPHSDISLGDPDLRRDALYGVLLGVLGFNAWNERTALVKQSGVVERLRAEEEAAVQGGEEARPGQKQEQNGGGDKQ